jgi:hypothetical protein
MTTLSWCPACGRTHAGDEVSWSEGAASARCAASGALLETEQPPAEPPMVALTPRPKLWHCIVCGWRCDDSWNDYLCGQCRSVRPFMGGSATLMQCGRCAQWNLLLARFCEWCGGALGAAPLAPGPLDGAAGTEPAPLRAPERPAPPAGVSEAPPGLLYDIPAYPRSLLLGEQHIVSEEASILWHAFTSPDEPPVVVAFYQERLGREAFSAEGAGGIWRWPADAPARVLHVVPVDDLGPHQQLTGKPPAEARTVIIISQRFVDADSC